MKNTLNHAYGQDRKYLGHVNTLNIKKGQYFDTLTAKGFYCTYNSDNGKTLVYKNGNHVATFQNVYSQNRVILGSIRIS